VGGVIGKGNGRPPRFNGKGHTMKRSLPATARYLVSGNMVKFVCDSDAIDWAKEQPENVKLEIKLEDGSYYDRFLDCVLKQQ
jgi:hypothetical protein